MKMFVNLVFLAVTIAGINAQGWAKTEPSSKIGYVIMNIFNECEGKDSAQAEYSIVGAQETDAQCSQDSVVTTALQMIAIKPNGERAVINLQILTTARFPDGANEIVEFIYLATSGPLEGKYLFQRIKHLTRDYLKTCSSVLGLSAIVSKNDELLISDRLSPEVLISNNPFEAFKKGCTTVCKGTGYLF